MNFEALSFSANASAKPLASLPAPRSLRPLKTARATNPLRVPAKTALTVVAALALLLFTLASVSPLHDESHRHDGSAAGHACVMCAFAKSQFTGAEPAPLVAPLAAAAGRTLPPLAVSTPLPASDHPLPPGRAPPVV